MSPAYGGCWPGTDREADWTFRLAGTGTQKQSMLSWACQRATALFHETLSLFVILPVNSPASFHFHPVESKVNLADKGRHPLHHRARHAQDDGRLFTHDPGRQDLAFRRKVAFERLPRQTQSSFGEFSSLTLDTQLVRSRLCRQAR